jgi:hypothetical protein
MREIGHFFNQEIWRFSFGVYLFVYLVYEFPYVGELYSSAGLLPLTPSIWNHPVTIFALQSFATLAALSFTGGYRRRTSALVLFVVAAWKFGLNPISESPELAFLNWILLAQFLIQDAHAPSRAVRDSSLIVLATAYCYSAVSKWFYGDLSWRTGMASWYALADSSSHLDWYMRILNTVPAWVFGSATFFVLAIEFIGPLAILHRTTTKLWWIATTLLHLTFLLTMNLAQLSLGMLFFHWFVYIHASRTSWSVQPFIFGLFRRRVR